MNAANIGPLGDTAISVTAAATTDLPPGRSVLSFTAAAPVTVTLFRAAKTAGRIIMIMCAIGSSPITLTHTDIATATTGQVHLAQRQNVVLNPGDQILLRQHSTGTWSQVGDYSPVYIKSAAGGGASRVIPHGLSSTPKIAALQVTTSAGAAVAGWTLGVIDGTNVNITLANATDIVYLTLIP